MNEAIPLYLDRQNPEIAQILQNALFNYFGTIYPLKEMADQDGFWIECAEDKITMNQRQGEKSKQIGEYKYPIKLGNVLQTLQIIQQNQVSENNAQPLNFGRYILHPETNVLKKSENEIRLTDKEYEIIKTLYEISPSKISRDDLLHKIWGYGDNIETHTLETHIYRLRQKVEDNPSEPDFLKTDDDGYYLNF